MDENGCIFGWDHVTIDRMETDDSMDDAPNVATLKISPAVLAHIAEIDEFKGAWRAIGRLAPDRLAALRRVATIESIGSSTRIEGVRLTDREVERLLGGLRIRTFATRDEQEVVGYADVMATVFESWSDVDLTENHIRQLHRDLLRHVAKDARHRGEYKTLPNHVEAFGPAGESLGIVFATAAPFDTPRLMTALVAWTRDALAAGSLHPLLVIAVFVVVFLEIHPFQDGNGRLSRILTTLLLLRAGYAYVPYSSLESAIEQSKEDYYLALRRTQVTIRREAPDWQPWLDYFLGALQRQKRALEVRIERDAVIFGGLAALSAQILQLAREHGRVSVSEAAKFTGASRNTIKDHIRALVENGRLARRGAGRSTWYAPGG